MKTHANAPEQFLKIFMNIHSYFSLLNDNQIRLEILLDYYKAMRNQSRIPHQGDNEKLKEIDHKEYDFNYGYLVKHKLVEGSIHYSDDGAEHFTSNGGITGIGMDIVEQFIDNCIDSIEKTKKNIDKNISYFDKIVELVSIWASNSESYQQAWELLSTLITNLFP